MPRRPQDPQSDPTVEATIDTAVDQAAAYGQYEGSDLATMVARLNERDAERQEEMNRLGTMLQHLTQLSSIECILTNGFEEISSRLVPLADLSPQRSPLASTDQNGDCRLQSLLDATERPNWSGATSVAVVTAPVPHIGEVCPTSYCGSTPTPTPTNCTDQPGSYVQ